MKILFWIPYPVGKSPSQRFRFEQYVELLEAHGISVELCPFWKEKSWKILYVKGHYLEKTMGMLVGISSRIKSLVFSRKFSFIFIHREAAPLGPPFFEWVISKILRKKIIYDFDDAIWLPNTSTENKIVGQLKWHSKVQRICQWSERVSVGNSYLLEYAKPYCSEVILNPTTIDTEKLHNPSLYKKMPNRKLVIGWTGTHSTLPYLDVLLPVFIELEKKWKGCFTLRVIANKKPDFNFSFMEFVPWKKEQEIEDLIQFDIGIMPLTDDRWAKGKCGFKALQYMALKIPTIASPVGVNTTIIDHEKNGLLADSNDEWLAAFELLFSNPELCKKMGELARKKVIENYSVVSNTTNFLSLFAMPLSNISAIKKKGSSGMR